MKHKPGHILRQKRPSCPLLLLASLIFTPLSVGCKKLRGSHAAAADAESPLSAEPFFHVFDNWNRMDPLAAAMAAGIKDGAYWARYPDAAYLKLFAFTLKHAFGQDAFPKDYIVGLTLADDDKPLFLKWNKDTKRLESESVEQQVVASFINSPTMFSETPIATRHFVIEMAKGQGQAPPLNGYIGEKVNGKRSGKGVLPTEQGTYVATTWRDGTPTGDGTVKTAGGVLYKGTFVDDHLEGPAVVLFPSGNQWHETYHQGVLVASSRAIVVDEDKAKIEETYQFGDALDYSRPLTSHVVDQEVANAAEAPRGSADNAPAADAAGDGADAKADAPDVGSDGTDASTRAPGAGDSRDGSHDR